MKMMIYTLSHDTSQCQHKGEKEIEMVREYEILGNEKPEDIIAKWNRGISCWKYALIGEVCLMSEAMKSQLN